MDGDLSALLLKGGPVALIAAILYAAKWGVEAFLQYRRTKANPDVETDVVEKVSPVADAATTNALLLDSLQSERSESRRRGKRIDELEAEVDELRDALFIQKRQYERELGDLRSKVQEVTLQLEGLQARIAASIPDTIKEADNG